MNYSNADKVVHWVESEDYLKDITWKIVGTLQVILMWGYESEDNVSWQPEKIGKDSGDLIAKTQMPKWHLEREVGAWTKPKNISDI